MWTIMNKGRYVKAHCYSGSSYTYNPREAIKFDTEEEARKNACGNEQVVKMQLIWA